MPLETRSTLDQDTRDGLNDLIKINLDSAEGFKTAADAVERDDLQVLFNACAADRERFAAELATAVKASGGDVDDNHSIRGTVHRWWLLLRGTVQGGDARAVLAEAERGEDEIKARYEDVLRATSGSAMNDVLTRQYADVKRTHDRIRDLRDAQ